MRIRFALASLLVAFALGTPPLHAQISSNSTTPIQVATKTSALAATTSSSRIQLLWTGPGNTIQVQVFNQSTTATAFCNFGSDNTVTASVGTGGASTSDYPIAPGAVIVVTVPNTTNQVWAACILSTSTGNVYFTPGFGQ